MKPTIEDVARLAQVSPSTVSRVIQDSPRISAETKARVRAAIKLLNYEPNILASALRRKRTRVIGVVISDNANPLFAGVVRGITTVAQARRVHVILCNSDNSPAVEEEHVKVLLQRQVDGLIISVSSERGRALDVLRGIDRPLVFINRRPVDLEGASVVSENEEAVRNAVAHLIAAGHRRIAFLVGNLQFSTGRERLSGYQRALEEAGIPLDPALVNPGDFNAERAYRSTLELLDMPDAPTAIMSSDVYSTAGMLRAVQSRNVRVPDELSLIGYDNHEWTELLSPPLTIVAQPAEQIGAEAARILLDQVESGTLAPAQQIRLPCRLIERRSVAPPRASALVHKV